MSQYDNTNRGTIGRNKRKEQDNHPDLSGQINVEGKEYWLSGWKKQGREGDTFYSLSVKPKEVQQTLPGVSQGGRTPGKAPIDLDDEIPF
jgi:hypothetical protein